eukprot:7161102-Alexandrium_andersonii.AAC.1
MHELCDVRGVDPPGLCQRVHGQRLPRDAEAAQRSVLNPSGVAEGLGGQGARTGRMAVACCSPGRIDVGVLRGEGCSREG